MLTRKTLDQTFDRAVQAAGAEAVESADAAGERLAAHLRTALEPSVRQLDQASANLLIGALFLGVCLVATGLLVSWK